MNYIFASRGRGRVVSPRSVFYRVTDAYIAKCLCQLFLKNHATDNGGTNFHYVSAPAVSASGRKSLNRAIELLELQVDRRHSDCMPLPDHNQSVRAAYLILARRWEELLREELEAAEALPGNDAESTEGAKRGVPDLPSEEDCYDNARVGMLPKLPRKDWLNASLTLLSMFAEAYYSLLESVFTGYHGSHDPDLNRFYIYTRDTLQCLLGNHPDLKDFPMPLKPVFPDLLPPTIRDVQWEDTVAPDAGKFLRTVEEYVMGKGGTYEPRKGGLAWVLLKPFKADAATVIESGVAYRKRMNRQFQKLTDQIARKASALLPPPPPGSVPQKTKPASPTLEAVHAVARETTAIAQKENRLETPTVDSPSAPRPRYMLRQGSGHWLFTVNGLDGHIADEKGLRYVEYLFKNPPTEPIHATDLQAEICEMDTNAEGVTEIVDPDSGKSVTLSRTARLQERNLSVDDREAMDKIWRIRRSYKRVIDDQTVTGMERDEAQAELTKIDETLASAVFRNRSNAAKTYDRIRQAISRLLKHLDAKKTKDSEKDPAYQALAEHVRQHLIGPSRRYSRTRTSRTRTGTAQTFLYERPDGVVWSD